jgi:transposase
MMGEQLGRQDRLFYEFCLDDRVPADHLLRRIDAVLDLSWLRAELAPYYSHTGCPSVDPELLIRMLLIGYCYSIRSERRLCREVEMNLAYRWFCRLGLEDEVPDHSTFSVNRHGRFRDSYILRQVFKSVVRGCMSAGHGGGWSRGHRGDRKYRRAPRHSCHRGVRADQGGVTHPRPVSGPEPGAEGRARGLCHHQRRHRYALDVGPLPSGQIGGFLQPSGRDR